MPGALKLAESYTWDDYRNWPESEHWEIIGGTAFAMSPSPQCDHQDLCGAFYRRLQNFFKGKRGRAFISPMDVKLSEEDVVQPDLLVVCNSGQIKGHIEGPPALVVEIISEASVKRDRIIKTELYARFGIQEYWLVTPFPSLVEVLLLREGKYLLWQGFSDADTLASPSFHDLKIELAGVFEFAIEQHTRNPAFMKEPAAPPYVAKPPPARPGASG